MSEIRARIADLLREHQQDCKLCTLPASPAHTRDVLLSLPGIAIVELPEPTLLPPVRCWFTPIGNVVINAESNLIHREGFRTPDDCRALAAALLAAANAAEATA